MTETAQATTAPPLATRREWIGLAVLALPTLLLAIDGSVLFLALPTLSADLDVDATQQLWILDIYSFLIAGLLVTMGTLGDRIGRRRLLLIGGSAFAAASVIAAFSVSVEMLIVARALLGIAGATLAPSTMALIRNMFRDPRQMAIAIGVWFTCFMGGMLLGPIVGGLLLEHFWWGSTFLLGVPFMVLLVVLGPIFLPEYRAADPGRIDLVSVALSLAAILPVVWGLKELARTGWEGTPVAAIAIGGAMAALFVRRQSRLADPLLDLTLFRNRVFGTSLVLLLVTAVIMSGVSLLLALFLQSALGLSPLTAGLWLLPQAVAMIIGFQVPGVLARWFAPPVIVTLGLAIAAVGFAVLTQAGQVDGPGLAITGFVIGCFGISLPMTVLTTLMLGSVPPDKAGAASAVNETSSEFGIALGIASLGSLAAVISRGELATSLAPYVPVPVPEHAAEAAGTGITAAVDTAASLPGEASELLLELARAAFTSGLAITAGFAALVFLALATLAAIMLRERRAGEASETPDSQTVETRPTTEGELR
ncbi:MFS transporter [Agromyces intestinalis]|uniref:MFS transporter n=1 Tax=Agromyces intestinalis TaxID=2592652 RepID=A0A5C1YFF2_9MICO|nr:MFS transporter [Agromyces intestinalis]QEO14916.1 MFS transporter [Agromyces intestinalis]